MLSSLTYYHFGLPHHPWLSFTSVGFRVVDQDALLSFTSPTRNRNLGISRAPLKSQVHRGTSLFTSAGSLFSSAEHPQGLGWESGYVAIQFNINSPLSLTNPCQQAHMGPRWVLSASQSDYRLSRPISIHLTHNNKVAGLCGQMRATITMSSHKQSVDFNHQSLTCLYQQMLSIVDNGVDLSKILGGQTKRLGEKVVKSDKCMGVSQLLGARAGAAP